jgi:hypothetical protein
MMEATVQASGRANKMAAKGCNRILSKECVGRRMLVGYGEVVERKSEANRRRLNDAELRVLSLKAPKSPVLRFDFRFHACLRAPSDVFNESRMCDHG